MQALGLNINSNVGASLLAKNVNDNACYLNKRGVYGFFASKLAPTWHWGKPLAHVDIRRPLVPRWF